jgi:1-deoxyxylulose-5-phosphate synthase
MDRVSVWAPKPHYVADAAAAVEITLTEDEIGQLEEPYPPQALYWS